jgi:hypothetical protein
MPTIMFTISYEVKPYMKDTYLGLVRQLKERFTTSLQGSYAVYVTQGKENRVTEVFQVADLAALDALEEGQDDATRDLIQRLEECKEKTQTRYSTWIEVT